MKLFIYNNKKYLNNDIQCNFCEIFLERIPKEKGKYYEARFIDYYFQIVINNGRGVEEIINLTYNKNKTLGCYINEYIEKTTKETK